MADNKGLDLFVAGLLLDDIGGPSNAGMDNFVAGVLYNTVESSGPTASLTGEAGGELLSTTVAAQRNTQLQAGGELLSVTMAVTSVVGTYATGAEMVHVVMVQGLSSVVISPAGSEMYAQTRKLVPADSIPGGIGLAGAGF